MFRRISRQIQPNKNGIMVRAKWRVFNHSTKSQQGGISAATLTKLPGSQQQVVPVYVDSWTHAAFICMSWHLKYINSNNESSYVITQRSCQKSNGKLNYSVRRRTFVRNKKSLRAVINCTRKASLRVSSKEQRVGSLVLIKKYKKTGLILLCK